MQPELKAAIDVGRLLLITPFENNVKRVTAETAEQGNRFIIEISDDIVIGYASKGGTLDSMITDIKNKKIVRIKE